MARMFRNIAKSERVLDLMRTFATMLAVAGVVFLVVWLGPVRNSYANVTDPSICGPTPLPKD